MFHKYQQVSDKYAVMKSALKNSAKVTKKKGEEGKTRKVGTEFLSMTSCHGKSMGGDFFKIFMSSPQLKIMYSI